MKVRCVWEHNGEDTLLYAENLPGAFTRGASKTEALRKMAAEAAAYGRWSKGLPQEEYDLEIVQEQESSLQIRDADSDVLFSTEVQPLSVTEYEMLKNLALRSAEDFLQMYRSIPDADRSCLPERKTFYGTMPRTAREMYDHTKNVNTYYFGEIGVDADNNGSIVECRQRGFAELEKREDYLTSAAVEGSYGEYWSVRKVLRRFLWHDRIHAKAMYRMAVGTFGADAVENVFQF